MKKLNQKSDEVTVVIEVFESFKENFNEVIKIHKRGTVSFIF